ncbi:MAG: SBBP repeat-containing protein [Acidobacteria bacterium]|nr:SBBP repeat-containing protein [Acidobacteriota bacterium]
MRSVLLTMSGLVCLSMFLCSDGVPERAAAASGPFTGVNVDFAQIPLYFVPNEGQVHPDVLYYAATPPYTLWATGDGLVFDQLRGTGDAAGAGTAERSASRLIFLNANLKPRVRAWDAATYRVNYFRGQEIEGQIVDIPTSHAVVYEDLYENVDLKVYGRGTQIEYDWLVRPGGRASDIGFRYEDIESSRIDESGNLEVEMDSGKLIHTKPYCYQPIGQNRVEVAARFVAREAGGYGFDVAPYDANYPLVIDPVVLVYSTYLGGSSSDAGNGIAVDASGAVYVSGFSASTDYPTRNPFQQSLKKDADVVVTKINPKGDGLVYSTYIGGSASDVARDIAIDSTGNAYVVGETDSTNFPVKNPFQGKRKGTRDVFVTKLSASGNALVFSTYLGGTQWESGYAIAVDSKNSAYLTGNTISPDFPLKDPYQGHVSSQQLAFVTKLQPDGTKLVYSTYLGGSSGSMGRGICVDGQGSAYVTGDTYSDDFPVRNPVQAARAGYSDAFVTKFDPQGSDLSYSTYFGGSSKEVGWGIAVAGNGAVYVTGQTDSTNLPTVKPFQAKKGGLDDVYVAKLDSNGSALLFSTYLGGSSYDYGRNLALDNDGNCYLVGWTYSQNFPVRQAFQTKLKGAYDAFVSKFNAVGKNLLYSTYLGGSSEDAGSDIAVGADRSAYVTGQIYSADFPLKGPIQPSKKGGLEGFVAKIR